MVTCERWGNVVLINLPPKKLPFQVGDEVRLKSNLEVSGEATEVCGSTMVKVLWSTAPSAPPQKFREEDLVLDNRFTTPPMKMPGRLSAQSQNRPNE